ncbi:MAG: hypothetical protein AAFO69_03950 [Bacteroidota bacterium]
MGDFDLIFKENIEAIFRPLLGKMLNISIKESFEIKDKIQTTIEREPDFLKRIVDEDDREFILHLEFQVTDNQEMVYRMAEYKALLQRKFKIPVRQHVIFLGVGTPMMRTQLLPEEQITGFDLQSIRDLSTESALSSEIPEEIILAILTDYPEIDAELVVRRIIEKLQQATTDELRLRRAIEQLLILSRLRKLQKVTKTTVDNMPITYDITEDELYQEGLEKGLEKGAEKKERRLVERAIRKGVYTTEQIADMIDVDIEFVLAIQRELEGGAK